MTANRGPEDEAEAAYADRNDEEWADPAAPNTFPSGPTIKADRADADADHAPDRPPTADEEGAAPDEVDPEVAQAYEEAIERGANVKGEGAI